jgi:hypothetical protein
MRGLSIPHSDTVKSRDFSAFAAGYVLPVYALQSRKKLTRIQDVVMTDRRNMPSFRPQLSTLRIAFRQTYCSSEPRVYLQKTAATAAAALSKWSV